MLASWCVCVLGKELRDEMETKNPLRFKLQEKVIFLLHQWKIPGIPLCCRKDLESLRPAGQGREGWPDEGPYFWRFLPEGPQGSPSHRQSCPQGWQSPCTSIMCHCKPRAFNLEQNHLQTNGSTIPKHCLMGPTKSPIN